jgi:hypothetical protein
VLTAGPLVRGDDRDRYRATLSVQVALEQGLQHLQRGQFAEAVSVLEQKIASIDGNRRYLMALRDAYRGHVRQLRAANRLAEARVYEARLQILEPVGATQESGRPGITARGTPAEKEPDDPFDPANRAAGTGLGGQRAHGLLARAMKAFEQKRYEEAAHLFGQADRLAPGSAAEHREQWAYSRLEAVVEALNRGAVPEPAALEREVRSALEMAPRFDRVADGILKRLKEPGGANVKVKHTPREGNGWAVAQTTNFKIYHAGPEEVAEKAARVAEATRLAMTRRWFGEMPADWSPPCVIYLHPTARGYASATGAPATATGHATWKQKGEQVLERRIDLPADNPALLSTALPCQTTHIVLGGRFGVHCLPRWADEAMGLLSEPREQVEQHLANLAARDGAFTLRELMAQGDWPEARRLASFYAQGVSLVDFLCQKKAAATFARFLREALDASYQKALARFRAARTDDLKVLDRLLTEELVEGGGYERALERFYGYRGFAELEAAWKQHAFSAAAVASRSDKR